MSGNFPTAANRDTDGNSFPLGFSTAHTFRKFIIGLYQDLPVRADDVNFVFQGSSVTGVSYKGRKPFDENRISDYDIAIASKKLFEEARRQQMKSRSSFNCIPALTDPQLQGLRLLRMKGRAQWMAARYTGNNREVNFVICDTVETAHGHAGASLVCEKPAIYDLNFSEVPLTNYGLRTPNTTNNPGPNFEASKKLVRRQYTVDYYPLLRL
jgi:hypothetical protein